jgi:hypothetical protein
MGNRTNRSKDSLQFGQQSFRLVSMRIGHDNDSIFSLLEPAVRSLLILGCA